MCRLYFLFVALIQIYILQVSCDRKFDKALPGL